MDYRLELLHEDNFEDLINTICQKILGTGVVVFSAGKDGGRDGKFEGTAEKWPSNTTPWRGKFIIQSKHTSNPIASCSDSEFETIIVKEIEKIAKLKEAGDVDIYLIFTNRKYSGLKGEELLKRILHETGVKHAMIIGKEMINKQLLNQNKEIVRLYKLDLHHIPFDFSDNHIRDIILSLKEQLPEIEADIKKLSNKLKYDFDRIRIEEKNNKNQLSKEYFDNEIVARSVTDFAKISSFLDNPINTEIKEVYYDIAAELSQIITVQRDNFGAFEEVFVYIYKMSCDGVESLRGVKRHVLTLLHHMYFECIIGKK